MKSGKKIDEKLNFWFSLWLLVSGWYQIFMVHGFLVSGWFYGLYGLFGCRLVLQNFRTFRPIHTLYTASRIAAVATESEGREREREMFIKFTCHMDGERRIE